jgi:hypothetical protein
VLLYSCLLRWLIRLAAAISPRPRRYRDTLLALLDSAHSVGGLATGLHAPNPAARAILGARHCVHRRSGM